MKTPVKTLVLVGLMSWLLAGCPANNQNNNPGFGIAGLSGCTTTSTGATVNCIPTLGQFGGFIHYSGGLNVTNIQGATSLIQAAYCHWNCPVSRSMIQFFSSVDIQIVPGSGGAIVTTTLTLANAPITGASAFIGNSSVAGAGTIELQPFTSSVMPVDIVSLTQPWDGSVFQMLGLTVNLNQTPLGVTSLRRIQ